MERTRQLSSSDAEDGFERSEMRGDDVFPLLSLPSGVEVVLLSVLSKGKGGLNAVLALREVCKITRSWVDNLPKSDADVVFSNAQVRMRSDPQSLRSFKSSSPPFGVTSLCLEFGRKKKIFQKDEKDWSSFCAWWNLKLKNLQLNDYTRCLFLNRRVAALMDSDNIDKISVTDDLQWHNSPLPLPSSFQKVSELHMYSFDCGNLVRAEFFSQLSNNHNLRVFTFEARSDKDLEGVTQLVDSKKDCPHFQLNLNLRYRFKYIRVFSHLAASILTSKSRVGLKLWLLDNWRLRHRPGDVLQLMSLLEQLSVLFPTEQTLSALTYDRRLNEVENFYKDSATAARLQFPPSLEKLTFVTGFASSTNLPEGLKELCVRDYKCPCSGLVGFLLNVKGRCPKLEKLEVDWWELPEHRDQTLNFEGPVRGFAKLRSLILRVELLEEGLPYTRLWLANAFNWRRLELHYIQVEFHDSQSRKLPLLDEEILRELLEGPSAKSLLGIYIDEEGVTLEAVPMLQKLKSLAAKNRERRRRAEGVLLYEISNRVIIRLLL